MRKTVSEVLKAGPHPIGACLLWSGGRREGQDQLVFFVFNNFYFFGHTARHLGS